MQTMHCYDREDMLNMLLDVTKEHTGARSVVTWVCDCGCDVAQWFRRTDKGLSFTQQAWPVGMTPQILVFENHTEVHAFVRGTADLMRLRGAGQPKDFQEKLESRIQSFQKAVWSAWADA